MREMMSNIIVIALSVAFLWHFSLIVNGKQVLIQEPNILIWSIEVTMFCAFITFAIVNIIKLVRSK